MKTAIDEVIKNLKECRKMYPEDAFADDIKVAITTMQKYQKIEDIVRNYYNEQYTDKLDIEIIEMISEVLEEDGRW